MNVEPVDLGYKIIRTNANLGDAWMDKVRHTERKLITFYSPFMSSGFIYHNSLDWSISNSRTLVSFYYYNVVCFIEIPIVNANSLDPDQTPHSALFAIYPFEVSRLKWKSNGYSFWRDNSVRIVFFFCFFVFFLSLLKIVLHYFLTPGHGLRQIRVLYDSLISVIQ